MRFISCPFLVITFAATLGSCSKQYDGYAYSALSVHPGMMVAP